MPAPISDYVPQSVAHRSPRGDGRALAVWGAVAAGALAFLGLIFSAPLMQARGSVLWSHAVYQAFGVVCHQMPERSFHFGGYPLAVCARCAGLYAGFAAGVLLYPLVRSVARADAPRRTWLFAAAAPLAADFALGFLGVWENTHLSRSTTGALVGMASVFYVIPGLVDLSRMSRRHFFLARPSERG
ncbi:MAG: DUF2085 domain-containing protein [Pyrinomonadaceae bacterium]